MTKRYDLIYENDFIHAVDKNVRGEIGVNYNTALGKIDILPSYYPIHSSEWNFCFKVIASTNISLRLPLLPDMVIKRIKQNPISVELEIKKYCSRNHNACQEMNDIFSDCADCNKILYVNEDNHVEVREWHYDNK